MAEIQMFVLIIDLAHFLEPKWAVLELYHAGLKTQLPLSVTSSLR